MCLYEAVQVEFDSIVYSFSVFMVQSAYSKASRLAKIGGLASSSPPVHIILPDDLFTPSKLGINIWKQR